MNSVGCFCESDTHIHDDKVLTLKLEDKPKMLLLFHAYIQFFQNIISAAFGYVAQKLNFGIIMFREDKGNH
jgi:hypothetical protein